VLHRTRRCGVYVNATVSRDCLREDRATPCGRTPFNSTLSGTGSDELARVDHVEDLGIVIRPRSKLSAVAASTRREHGSSTPRVSELRLTEHAAICVFSVTSSTSRRIRLGVFRYEAMTHTSRTVHGRALRKPLRYAQGLRESG